MRKNSKVFTIIFGLWGFEERRLLGPLLFSDVSHNCSGLVDGQTAEVLVEVNGSMKIQVSQIETFANPVTIPHFKHEDSIVVLEKKSGYNS